MKYYHLLLLLVVFSCSSKNKELKSKEIIAKSVQKHDPNHQWNTTEFKVQIQEPRIQNPYRYSIVKLNNNTGSFELQRNRNTSISKHIIDDNRTSKTLLDNKITTDTLLIKKYRLDPKRNFGYKRFYQLLLGLPMSLQNEKITIKEKVEYTFYNKKNAYKVNIELEKPLFSKHWNLFFSQEDFTLLGIEMIFLDDTTKGERLLFDGTIKINDISLPRIRHWYKLNNTYSGSDIILKTLK